MRFLYYSVQGGNHPIQLPTSLFSIYLLKMWIAFKKQTSFRFFYLKYYLQIFNNQIYQHFQEMSEYQLQHQPQYATSIYSEFTPYKSISNYPKRSQIVSNAEPFLSYNNTEIPYHDSKESNKWRTKSKIEINQSPLAFAGRSEPRRVLRSQNFLQKQQKKKSASFYPQLQELKKEVTKIIQFIPKEQQIPISAQKKLSECNSQQSLGLYYLKNKEDINPQQCLYKSNTEKSVQSRNSHQLYTSGYYSQLKNSQLKTQLKNLKNKYRICKLDYEEKIQVLVRKNQYLEQALKTAQEEILVYKNDLTVQMAEIRKTLNSQQQGQKHQDQSNQKNDENQCYKQRIASLYNELLQKNKRINQILIQVHDSKGELQAKNYQLKILQDKDKHHQIELENLKKEIERKEKYLQIQIHKNKQLAKQMAHSNRNESSTMEVPQMDIKEISTFDAKTHKQLEVALKNQGNLLKMIRKQNLQTERLKKKQRQYESQLQEYKKTITEKSVAINTLKHELESKSVQITSLSKSLEDARINQENFYLLQKKYDDVQRQFDLFKLNLQSCSTSTKIEKQAQQTPNNDVEQKIKLKDQQIQKWRIQYLVAKGKIQDRQKLEKLYKNRRIETYYQQYMSLKSRNEIIEPKLAQLQEQNKKFMEKMKTMEINQLNIRIKMKNDNNALSSAFQRINQELQAIKMRQEEIIAKSDEADRALQQSNLYRRNIQTKILLSQTTDTELKQAISIIKIRISDQDQKLAKQFRQIKNKDNLIGKLRAEVQQLLTNKQEELKKIQIKDIRQRVSQILNEQIYFVQEIKNSANKECQILRSRNQQLIAENSEMKNKIYFIEEDIIKINYQKQKLLSMYQSKLQESQKQESELSKIIQTVTKNYNQAQFEKKKLQTILKVQLANRDSKIQALSNEINKLSEYIDQRDLSGFSIQGQNKELQQRNSKLKKQLQIKDDQLGKTRDQYNILKIAHENLKSQLQIQKLKAISQRKNLQISLQIEIQNLKNQITINEKKIISLTQKIEISVEESKKKDGFIQNYIMGKKLPKENADFITQFVSKYQNTFSAKNIGDKLKEDLAEIERVYQINFNLLKEISTLKRKLSLYDRTQMLQVELNKTVSTPYQINKI